MSGTVRNTRGNIPYCSAECARTVESDTRSSLYKEHFSLENSIAAFRYVNAVSDYDGKPVFWHYGMEKLYLPFAAYVAGTVISAMALGSLGFAISILSNSAIAGYLTSAGYFLLNFLGNVSEKSIFYLFSMSKGNYTTKLYLLGWSLLMIAASLIYSRKRSIVRKQL